MVTTMPRESYARARSKLFFFAGKLENKKVWNSLAKNFKNRYNKRTRAHTHTHARTGGSGDYRGYFVLDVFVVVISVSCVCVCL